MLRTIVGPTASGKTRLALEVGQRLGMEVLSADSRQVYRYMDIGTAKPTPEERALVPHHLIDIVEPSERYDAARYQRDATACLSEVERRDRVPVLVGGTGLFVRAFVDGLRLSSLPTDPELRASLEAEAARVPAAALHARLAERDPVAAARVHPNNVRRIVRYLEVTELAGPVSSLWSSGPSREVRMIGLMPPREDLYRDIETRVVRMVEAGVLEETRRLLERGYDASLPSLSGHGYPHWIAHLEGQVELDDAIRGTQRDTRSYARRQITWFGRDARIRWFDPLRERAAALAAVLE